MNLSILKLILWPRDPKHEPRIIEFQPGMINVITGESASGKSSLSWIIDYCLGSEKCSIPVGLIRNVTSWFGLHLKLRNTEMIVARRNPEDQQSTSDLYWEEGLELNVPTVLSRNARVDDLKHRFNQISNLPSLDFWGDEIAGFGGRPSFRDMAAFNFQPQHIVANPYTLFFKADTSEHREKLRVIFPLVLGSIEAGALAKQRELKELERALERQQRELDARLRAAQVWEAEIGSYYLQAQSLGLLPQSHSSSEGWSLDKFMIELKRVPELVKTMDLPDIHEGTGEIFVAELTRLIEEEDKIGQEIGLIQRRLGKLDQLSSSVDDYSSSLTTQEDRVQGVGWFGRKIGSDHTCPVCLAVHGAGNPHLAHLQILAEQLKDLTAAVHEAPVKLDEESANLRKELRELEAAISKVRHKRKIVESRSSKQMAQRQKIRQIYLFVGRVEQALENVTASKNVDLLRKNLATLENHISALRKELDPRAQQDRLKAAIQSVSAKITKYAELLRLEHANENIRLNIRELTLQFSPLSGRTDYLWEVGSGQNWVGYHVATILALHEHFGEVNNNPVPRFIVIDQPSQVYFPEGWPEFTQSDEELASISRSADIEGVRRIFATLSQFMKEVSGSFQIIVTEHAGEITWRGLAGVNLVGNWREGHDEFLIPRAWLQ